MLAKSRFAPPFRRSSTSACWATWISGKKEGAKAKVGAGAGKQERGYFVQPTVFIDVKIRCRLREEIFGPVAAAIKFKDESDAVFQGNDTTYGLAAAVWIKDLSRAHKIARSPKAGTVDQCLWPDRSDVAVRRVQAIGLWP